MDEVKMTKNFIIKDCDQINNQFRYFNIIDFISIFQLNFSKKFKNIPTNTHGNSRI